MGQPQPPAPTPTGPARVGGRRPGTAWLSAIAAITVLAIVVVTKVGLDAAGTADGAAPGPATSASPDPVQVLASYLDYWPGVDCDGDTPAEPGVKAADRVQQDRQRCSLPQLGPKTTLFCIRYTNMQVMQSEGRPSNRRRNMSVRWERDWRRIDSSRGGGFVSYTLDADRPGAERAAIWWQDATSPVACMIHGLRDGDDALLGAFADHGFALSRPAPTPS